MEDNNRSTRELLEHLKLEQLEVNLFRGSSRDIGTPQVFGGQVLGQALLAASETVEGRFAHSLHAYFLRAGDPEFPIVYDVDRSRDGKSFTVRRVVAIQHGRPIFNMAASFQVDQEGVEHQFTAPEVPGPDEIGEAEPLPKEYMDNIPRKFQRWFKRAGPFEFRSVVRSDPLNPKKQPPYKNVWFRCRGKVPDDDCLHRVLLAYASDFHLIGTATLPHGLSYLKGNVRMASLDHALWIHRPPRVDDWLLYSCDSPNSSGSRGMTRGLIFDRQGTLIATSAQEGMIRAT